MDAFIKQIAYYLPQEVLTNEMLAARFPEWSATRIAEKVGIKKRHIASSDETASDMAVAAANALFREHNILPQAIDFILYCTQSPDYALPSTGCIIQKRLNIPTSAGALDFNLGCSGFIYGLAVAKGLISSGVACNVLLLTSETYSKYIHPEDKSNLTIFGDGAAATLISTDGFAQILDFDLGTDGNGADQLIVKNSGMRYPGKGPLLRDNFLFMDGAEIFNFTSGIISPLIDRTLLKNTLDKSNISRFILHQANSFMLEHLRRKLKIEREQFHNNILETGNTVSSTIPIALYQVLAQGTHCAGDYWLLAGFGVGYSWGGTIIYFNEQA